MCRSLPYPCLFDLTEHGEIPKDWHPNNTHGILCVPQSKHTIKKDIILPTGILFDDLPPGPLFPGKTEAENPSVCVPLNFGDMEDQLPRWVIEEFEEAGITLKPIRLYGENHSVWDSLTALITDISSSSAALLPLGCTPSDGRLALVHAAGLPALSLDNIAVSAEAVTNLQQGMVRPIFDSACAMRTVQDVRDQGPLLDTSTSELFTVCERLARKHIHTRGATVDEALVNLLDRPKHDVLQTVAENDRENCTDTLHLMEDNEIQEVLLAASETEDQHIFNFPLRPRTSHEDQLMGQIRTESWWMETLSDYFEDVRSSGNQKDGHFTCQVQMQSRTWDDTIHLCSKWQTATQNRLTRYRAAWHILSDLLPWEGRILFIGSNPLCQNFYTADFFGVDTVIHVDPDPTNNPDVVAYGEDLSTIEDQSIDGVAYFGTPYVMNNPQTFMAEASRVLKPGGLLSGGFNGLAARWTGKPYVTGACKESSEQWTFTPREIIRLHPEDMRLTHLWRTGNCYTYTSALKRG